VIHLAITKSHLLCAQWVKRDGKNILTALSSKSLNEPLLNSNPAKHIVSNIDSALQHIRRDIAFDGDRVYVSIPDSFCNHVMVDLDDDMTEHDGLEFSKWTINQRWPYDGDFEYFGRFYRKHRKVFVIRLARAFADPLKVAIQQLGSETYWMGTESSAFFGLNPEKGSTVIYPKKTDYKYFTYTPDGFLNGNIRNFKNSWKVNNENGSSYLKEIFKGQILILGELTPRRRKHFGSKRITQLTALSGFILEGVAFPRNLNQDDQEKLHVLTPIANGKLKGVVINFFDGPGFQEYTYGNSDALKNNTLNNEVVKVNEEVLRGEKKSVGFFKFTFILIISILFGLFVLKREAPDLYKNYIEKQLNNFPALTNFNLSERNFLNSISEKFLSLLKNIDIDNNSTSEALSVVKTVDESLSVNKILSSSLNLSSITVDVFDRFSNSSLIELSSSQDMLSLNFVGSKNADSLIANIGEVVSFSLRQIEGESLYLHGFIIKIGIQDYPISSTEINKTLLEAELLKYETPVMKSLSPINENGYLITPIILKFTKKDESLDFLNYINNYANNISLDKFDYSFESETNTEKAFLFLSIYSKLY
tara:strand:+ start:3055 stop:4827 length:1773 start_codon:yes stop_codon:yes gene_type:complete